MRRCPTRWDRGRAVIAVIALYALCLQAFLGGLAPIDGMAAPVGGGVICAHQEDAPAGDPVSCPDHACCLAVHAAQPFAPPPAEAGSAAIRPRRARAAIPWGVAHAPRARAPPGLTARPRGPPAV